MLILLIIIFIFIFAKFLISSPKDLSKIMYLASDINNVALYSFKEDTLICSKYMVRGSKVVVKNNDIVRYQKVNYKQACIRGSCYYIKEDSLVNSKKDVVKEEKVYVRIPTIILENNISSRILAFAKKEEELEVVDYNYLDKDGYVDTYKVRQKGKYGYVYGKYLAYSKEEAAKNYNQDMYDNIYSKVSNSFGGGDAFKLDYYPQDKPVFDDNIMPKSVYSLYLNCSSKVINNIDEYIEFAKGTKINSFVVDIKDNEAPAYPADIFRKLSPTNYKHAINSYEKYKEAISKLKQAGFYVIGRITTFKDSYYVMDNPNVAIMDKNKEHPYLHNGSYWPSAYNRDVWYYNVALALESIKKFGFNEINFDYVRFPDRMQSVSNRIDLRNTYDEDKTQAIERFIRYAVDEIHKLKTYVSIDVFGESANGTYTTAYGQYWPSISNIADVISGMPYPDHFSDGYYGIAKPWNQPYKLLNTWGIFAFERQKETLSQAKVRTWIQAYDVMKYVDFDGISYNAEELEQEIRALYEAGLNGGYITWLANSSLDKYKKQKDAFEIDYVKEYSIG